MPFDIVSVVLFGSATVGLLAQAVRSVVTAPSDEPPEDLRTWRRQDIARFRAPGEGKVSGRVRLHGRRQLRAPLSGEPCVAYTVRLLVVPVLPRPGLQGASHLERDEFRAVSFVLEDSSGRALVRRTAEAPDLHEEVIFSVPAGDRPPEAVLDLLGERFDSIPAGHRLDAIEGRLPVDSMVAVSGHGTTEFNPDADDDESSYRTAASRLVMGPLDDGGFLVSNRSFNPPPRVGSGAP